MISRLEQPGREVAPPATGLRQPRDEERPHGRTPPFRRRGRKGASASARHPTHVGRHHRLAHAAPGVRRVPFRGPFWNTAGEPLGTASRSPPQNLQALCGRSSKAPRQPPPKTPPKATPPLRTDRHATRKRYGETNGHRSSGSIRRRNQRKGHRPHPQAIPAGSSSSGPARSSSAQPSVTAWTAAAGAVS